VRRAALVAAVALALGSSADARDLPAEKERALRELLTRVLAESDPAARRKLASTADALAADAPIAQVVAAVRKGPILGADATKPRKVGGKTEEWTKAGNTLVGPSFVHAGNVYRYAVDVPSGYDPAKPAGLLLDPGHGTGLGKSDREKAGFLEMWRRFAGEAGHRDWIVARTEIIEQVGADGARGALPEDEVVPVYDAFFRDLFSRWRIDPDQVVVTGLSQTGYWAWYLGAAQTDRYAVIAPMSAVTGQVEKCAGNFLGVPVLVLHGEADPICEVAQPRRMSALLRRVGADVTYEEIAGAKHDYSVWKTLPAGLARLGPKPRERYPRRISKSVRNTLNPWRAWLRIDAVDEEAKGSATAPMPFGADGEVEGQTVRVFTEGVRALTVHLSSDLVDLAKPVQVVWNGKIVHDGPVRASAATLFEVAGDKCDWTATFEAAIPLRR
jgi:dienelactone hydrolase